MPNNTISDHYGPTIFGPKFDAKIDTVGAGYVVHYHNESALEHLTHQAAKAAPEALDVYSMEEFEGRVEWWVRENYGHLPEP